MIQEQAAHLHIDVTTLARYEGGRLKADQSMVARMALLYRNRKIKVWYLKFYNPELADAVLEPADLCSDGEAAIQCDIASKLIKGIYKKTRKYLQDNGKFEKDEIEELNKKLPEMKNALNEYARFIHYIENLADKMKQ